MTNPLRPRPGARRAAFAAALLLLAVGIIPARVARAQTSAAAAPIPAAAMPKTTLDVLANGLRVIVVERRGSAKIVAIDLRVRAGIAHETPENNGVAHFLEHLIFKGTPTRPPGDVDGVIEGVGGELTANTSLDWAQFAATVPFGAFRQALEVLADVVQNPALRASDLETERRVILDEMAAAELDPVRSSLLALSARAFPDHPYRLSLYGSAENVQRFTRDDVLAFWRALYVPTNMTLVVVGDAARANVLEAARAFFTFPNAAAAAPTPNVVEAVLPDPAPLTGVVRAAPLVRDRSLVTVTLGFRAPAVRAAEDAVALDALLPLLATGGEGGRLGDALVRKQNLALSVSAGYLTQRAPGLLTVSATGRGGEEKQLEDALLAEIRRLREDGVSEAEADNARRSALGQTLFEQETFAGQASVLAFYDVLGAPDFAARYVERLASVSAADLARVIRAYLTPDRCVITTVVPVKEAARR